MWAFCAASPNVAAAAKIALGVAAGLGLALLLSRPASAASVVVPADDAQDDETALARMLASEDGRKEVRIVLAWIVIERAKRAKQSLYQFITSGNGYGRQDEPGKIRHAGTSRPPTKESRQLAFEMLAGKYRPSADILARGAASYVERNQTIPDSRLVELQARWREGAYAQLAINGKPTGWILYSRSEPLKAGKEPSKVLDQLPLVEAVG